MRARFQSELREGDGTILPAMEKGNFGLKMSQLACIGELWGGWVHIEGFIYVQGMGGASGVV